MDHSVVTDYYALGVITYELMLGRVRKKNGGKKKFDYLLSGHIWEGPVKK